MLEMAQLKDECLRCYDEIDQVFLEAGEGVNSTLLSQFDLSFIASRSSQRAGQGWPAHVSLCCVVASLYGTACVVGISALWGSLVLVS